MTVIHKSQKLVASLVVALLMLSCSGTPSDERSEKMVKTTKVQVHQPTLIKSYPARIKASSNIDLAFRVAGPIKKIYVDEGQFVKKGDLLAQIDPRDYKLQLQGTEAKYKEVKAEVERITALHEKGKVSDNDFDKAVSGLKQITAKYHAHKNALYDTRLTAPFSGSINKIYFHADETVNAGMPVVSIIDTQEYEIVAHLPASDYLNRHSFKNFKCNTVDNPDNKLPLKLKNIVSQANLNGLYPAYFSLQNQGDGKILPGMSAEIVIEYQTQNDHLFTVPSTSIFKSGNQTKVWIYNPEQQIIHSREVEILQIKSSGDSVVKGKLSDNDIIVSAGVHSLTEGQKVKQMPPPSESNVGGLL
jgi:RND family efflux transporter MFP subunit